MERTVSVFIREVMRIMIDSNKIYSLPDIIKSMEMPEKEEDEIDFKTVKVYGRLITGEDPNFDKVYGDVPERLPVNKDNIVLPVFDVIFEDYDKSPRTEVNKMIQDEIQDTISRTGKIEELAKRVRPREVKSLPPYGKPKTTSVHIGNIAVTPKGDGLVSKLSFDELEESILY